jgi:hypothetical protein
MMTPKKLTHLKILYMKKENTQSKLSPADESLNHFMDFFRRYIILILAIPYPACE